MTITGTGGVQARVAGSVTGQLAVGNNIVQYNVAAGGVVYHQEPAKVPVPKLRPRVPIKGRAPKLVGRAREVEAALATLAPDNPIEFHGVPGVGKSALLKHLGHHPPPGLASTVAYHACGVETVEDTLQFLYEVFYETAGSFKPTSGDLAVLLAGVRGLVALDDLTLERTQVDAILDALPEATFLLASERRRLWGQGESVPVRGLDEDEAISLLERKLRRPVTDHERVAARDACRALEGHPLRVEQLATLVQQLGEPIGGVAPSNNDGPPVEVLVDRLRSKMGPEQLQVLAALGAVLGASLSAEHLGTLVGAPDIAAVVEPLLRTGLVQAHSPRYSLREPRAAGGDTGEWARRVADHLAEAARTDSDPGPVAEEAGAILALLARLRADGDHAALLRLSSSTERALMLGRRWGAWQVALQDQLEAARALGDRRSAAWALHQLGTRALCLGDEGAARSLLAEALALREDLGDRIGASATRHNLDLIGGPPPPPPPPTAPTAPPSPWRPPPATPPPVKDPDRRWPPGIWWAASAVALLLLVSVVATTLVGPDPIENAGSGQSTTTTAGSTSSTLPPVPATGTVVADPGSLRFGDQPLGTASLSRTVTFANGTTSPMKATGVKVEGSAPESFAVTASTCTGAAVPARSRCTVDVVFRPGVLGDQSATLRLAAAGAPAVGLAGRGVDSAEGEIRLDPNPVTFGDQPVGTTSPAVTVRVTSSSPSRVVVQSASVSSTDFRVDTGACSGLTLARGSSCALTVTFRPTAAGDLQASLLVTTSAGVSVAVVQGVGQGDPRQGPQPTTATPPDTGRVVSEVVGVAPGADLVITKSSSSCGNFCDVKVTNQGPATATEVQVTFDPATAVYNAEDPRCKSGTCLLGTLPPGATTSVPVLTSDSTIRPVASVTSQQNDSANANNKVTL